MEVFETENYYIFVNKGKSLWWDRNTSEFQVKCGKFYEKLKFSSNKLKTNFSSFDRMGFIKRGRH
jgi:hypothetical protein